ncbi:MAG TPA: glycosyltransferase family 4 protein [Candidatus Peribacteria bacterium]|nr:glycosyltransferase family 4 protein [Candidatus Peribacteria bacterium]
MKIVLATGIYPPDIGGPATYVRELARELTEQKHEVTVLTYQTIFVDHSPPPAWKIIRVPRGGGMFFAWRNYSKALKQYANDADCVVCFSSVSCGVPLWMSGITKPKTMLRLGGDFFWERYTAVGGGLGLQAWYTNGKPESFGDRVNLFITRFMNGLVMGRLLNRFDHVVYSTQYQLDIHKNHYKKLPDTLVLQNALPGGSPMLHAMHSPLKLLFLGRFVRFKNVIALLHALRDFPDATLTMTGEGPERLRLKQEAEASGLSQRVTFLRPVLSEDKQRLFADHDLLVLPSITEISPNVALEARGSGLPVLLTQQTGLSGELTKGMVKAPLHTAADIARAIASVKTNYADIAREAASPPLQRPWSAVAQEWVALFSRPR